MSHIHVCLVSGQPIPNLIPLRISTLKPERVILLVSPDMTVQADRLERLLRDWKIVSERKEIDPFNLESARETCLSLLAEHENDDISLNVTGGTKIMAFAAFEVFREMKRPIIYVDTQNKDIQIFAESRQHMPFESVLKVKHYLSAYGQELQCCKTDEKRIYSSAHKTVCDHLIANIGRLEKSVSSLNFYASAARDARSFPAEQLVNDNDLDSVSFNELIDLYAENSILAVKENKLIFDTAENTNFASGDWLDEYIYRVIKKAAAPTDIRLGVQVSWDQKGSKPTTNEYDVVFTVNNQLYLIEGKTKRFTGNDKKETTSDPIYKLDSLRDAAGGLFGKGMLISYKQLTPEQKERLSANRLNYCDGPALKNLDQKIKEWIK